MSSLRRTVCSEVEAARVRRQLAGKRERHALDRPVPELRPRMMHALAGPIQLLAETMAAYSASPAIRRWTAEGR